MGTRLRAAALTLTATVTLLALATHRPGPHAAPDDPTGAIVVAAAWLTWVLVGYLALAVAITASGHLVAAGRATDAGLGLSQRLAPHTVRRLVDAAIGATTAVMVVTAGAPVAAYAEGAPGPGSPVAAQQLDWPGLTQPGPDRPELPASPVHHASRIATDLVVQSGDSLWTVTARHLGAGASDAEIATTWPRLYAANRAVIGPDPALIHPGQRLVPPPPQARSPR